jgi:hypothetical protein
MFNTEDQCTKHTNIATINNQYLIRNYLQMNLKCQAANLGFGRSRIPQQKVVKRKGLEL